jgi:hypothetical protein
MLFPGGKFLMEWSLCMLSSWPRCLGTVAGREPPLATVTVGRDAAGVYWRRRPVECLPSLLFSVGPSLCSLPNPGPHQGREWSRKGPIARPFLCRRSLISALHTVHWTHPLPGVLGLGGGGEEKEEVEEEWLTQGAFSSLPPTPQPSLGSAALLIFSRRNCTRALSFKSCLPLLISMQSYQLYFCDYCFMFDYKFPTMVVI